MAELGREQLLERVRAAGVVGAGGGGFPAHAKYTAQVGVVIANGAECEPLIRVDQLQMARRPAELLRGLELVMRMTGASLGVIGLKAKYHDAIDALRAQLQATSSGQRVRLLELGNYYPAGDEFVLVREVLGKAIPEFGLPLSVGAVVSNVGTLIDVAAAVDHGRPVTRRLVTVAGEVVRAGTFEVPVGTPLSALLEAAGGARVAGPALLPGGPMMGQLTDDPQAPVTKTTSALLVLPQDHPVVARRRRSVARQLQLTRAACLKCMMCSEVCPRNLLGHRLYPDRLMRSLAAGVAEDLEAYRGAYLCSECGLCAVYGCVMNLDPAYVNRELKRRLQAAGVPRPTPREAVERVFGPVRKVPTARLIARLGLGAYDLPAPLAPFQVAVRRLVLPLKQHAGLPARPVVATGARVEEGALLGEIPEGKLGARIHAPRSGVVAEVTPERVVLEVG
ncbi:MAG TPA: SLBB domain-containing protein [Myxococcota bacterium]|nr:SLBB domain-containing protein [Myxococcota bacterium]HRY93414.1 SLBB domain-containing protein [Myxococcota bacterium]HSA21325.1 SLBB domain-containing protein [Myxococcota bacterium]